MMKRLTAILLAAGVLSLGSSAQLLAHPGHEHKVMGTVTMAAADHIMLKDKDAKDVTIKVTKETQVKSKPAMKVEEIKVGTRVVVTAIEQKDIPPKQSAEFVFRARNPSSSEIVWKAHQHFADGTTADWVGPAGDRRPAAVTKLTSAATSTVQASNTEAAAIETWLKGYDAAFMAKDLDKLAAFYHPDVTIYEGGGINNGWADYRDRHLGPELKAFENLQFGHSNTRVSVLPGGQSAYATSEYFIKAKMGERVIDSRGLETLVLIKTADGSWKIRHSHTSSRPAPKPAGK
jgi:ketosteroid isomerase-like protein